MTVKEISTLYNQLYRPLCIYSFKYTKDYEVSEDIVQDCFSGFIEKVSDGKSRIGNARAYLYSAARDRCIDLLRTRGTEVHMSPDFPALLQLHIQFLDHETLLHIHFDFCLCCCGCLFFLRREDKT